MALLTQSALLVAITAFSMGISVLARRTTNRLAQRYSMLCLVIWASFFSFFLKTAYGDSFFSSVQLLAWSWLGPAGMALFPLLVGEPPVGWRLLRSVSLGLAVFLTVSVLAGFVTEDAKAGRWGGLMLQALRFSPSILMAQTVLLLVTLRPLSIRDGFILAGAAFTLISTPLDHISWLGHTIPALGNLWFCGYLMLLGQAITRRKLLDAMGLLVRLVVLIVTAVALTALYLLVATWSEATPGVFLLHSFAVSFLLVLLLEPLQEFVAFVTGKILLQGRSKRLKLDLARIEQELRTIQDPAHWQRHLESALCRIFDASNAGWERHLEGAGQQHGAIDSEILRRRAMNETSILAVDSIERDLALSATNRERERLEALGTEMARAGAQVIVPFFDGDLMGWVWLSGLVPGARLSSLGNAAILGEVDTFARRVGPVVRTMLRIRSLAEQERLAALGELSAGLAHEIRNPLGAIRGALDLMPASEWTGLIRSETDRLEGLVRQFLDLSRRREQEMEWIDPSRWIGQIRARLAAKDLHWSQVPANGAGFVGDPERLLQVIENWVQNSRQAGAHEIRVGVVQSQDARELGVFVEDDGEGIAESEQQKIFAPFFTTRREGTGLGLSICRQIAQNHDGRIQVSSERGKGSRFVLWLPASAREQR